MVLEKSLENGCNFLYEACYLKQQIRHDLFSQNLFSRPNLLRSKMEKNVIEDDCCFLGVHHKAINTM